MSAQPFDGLVDQQRSWLEKSYSHLIAREKKYLDGYFSEPSWLTLDKTSHSLHGIAICYGTKGELDTLDGNPEGPMYVYRSLVYHYWSLRGRILAFHHGRKTGRLTSELADLSNLLCSAMALNHSLWISWVHSVIESIQANPSFIGPGVWEQLTINRVACRLYDSYMASDSKDLDHDLANILGDPLSAKVSNSIVISHCRLANEYHDFSGDFDHAPFFLIPWELIAYYEIRKISYEEASSDLYAPIQKIIGVVDHIDQIDYTDEIIATVKEMYTKLEPSM